MRLGDLCFFLGNLHEKDGVTALVITQEGVKSQEALKHSEQNWQSVFEGLKKIIEK